MSIGPAWINGYDLLQVVVCPLIVAAVVGIVWVCLDERISLPWVAVAVASITAVLFCGIAALSLAFQFKGLI